jgi:hypothetical protein
MMLSTSPSRSQPSSGAPSSNPQLVCGGRDNAVRGATTSGRVSFCANDTTHSPPAPRGSRRERADPAGRRPIHRADRSPHDPLASQARQLSYRRLAARRHRRGRVAGRSHWPADEPPSTAWVGAEVDPALLGSTVSSLRAEGGSMEVSWPRSRAVVEPIWARGRSPRKTPQHAGTDAGGATLPGVRLRCHRRTAARTLSDVRRRHVARRTPNVDSRRR